MSCRVAACRAPCHHHGQTVHVIREASSSIFLVRRAILADARRRCNRLQTVVLLLPLRLPLLSARLIRELVMVLTVTLEHTFLQQFYTTREALDRHFCSCSQVCMLPQRSAATAFTTVDCASMPLQIMYDAKNWCDVTRSRWLRNVLSRERKGLPPRTLAESFIESETEVLQE